MPYLKVSDSKVILLNLRRFTMEVSNDRAKCEVFMMSAPKCRADKNENGFTLIELFVVLFLISTLSVISFQNYQEYRNRARYSVTADTMYNARLSFSAAEADPDLVLPAVSQTISDAGRVTDGAISEALPGFALPIDVSMNIELDPSCEGAACDTLALTVLHCKGDRGTTYARNGNGQEYSLEKILFDGC